MQHSGLILTVCDLATPGTIFSLREDVIASRNSHVWQSIFANLLWKWTSKTVIKSFPSSPPAAKVGKLICIITPTDELELIGSDRSYTHHNP